MTVIIKPTRGKPKAFKGCRGTGKAELTRGTGFVREHTLDMVSELHNITGSRAARVAVRLR